MAIRKPGNLVDYIVTHTDLTQADLARKLKVTPAQISKWKAGDHISRERTSELLALSGLFETVNIEWAMFAKSEENAQRWYSYVIEIVDDVEWGHTLKDFFKDVPDIYVGHLVTDLSDLGAKIEQTPPTNRWIDDDKYEPTPLASAFFSILEAWGQLKDWIDDTLDFDDVTDDVDAELFEATQELEWSTFDLALGHVQRHVLTAIGIKKGRLDAAVAKSRKEIKGHLHDICQIRTKYGLPITENYFQLLYLPPEELAEQSWFRPNAIDEHVDENLIKSYLPYGQRLILSHLECSALALKHFEEKLECIIQKIQ